MLSIGYGLGRPVFVAETEGLLSHGGFDRAARNVRYFILDPGCLSYSLGIGMGAHQLI